MLNVNEIENPQKIKGCFSWFFKKKVKVPMEKDIQSLAEVDDKIDEEIEQAIGALQEPFVEEPEWEENAALCEYDPMLELNYYKMPPVELLSDYQSEYHKISDDHLINNKNKIVELFANHRIQIIKITATIGPMATVYEIVLASGTRISKIKDKNKFFEDDIAMNLATQNVQIIAPMPGKGTIGILVPNIHSQIVSLRSVIVSPRFQESGMELPIALGKTILNESFVFDLTQMPHLLIAGSSGQGKTVSLNVIISSILYKKHPSQVKMVIIDFKSLDFTPYEQIERHFLAKLQNTQKAIITNTPDAVNTLHSLCMEMNNRYDFLKRHRFATSKNTTANLLQED